MKNPLQNIEAGDIFHAESPNGASLICLTLDVNETTIRAKTVTTQVYLEFDRYTGVAVWETDSGQCLIDSVAPLPTHIHNAMLEFDRKFGTETDPEKFKLSEEEKRALIYVHHHYHMHKISIKASN